MAIFIQGFFLVFKDSRVARQPEILTRRSYRLQGFLEEDCQGTRQLRKAAVNLHLVPNPTRKISTDREALESIITKQDDSIIVFVANDSTDGLVHSPRALQLVPLVPRHLKGTQHLSQVFQECNKSRSTVSLRSKSHQSWCPVPHPATREHKRQKTPFIKSQVCV